MSIFQIGQQSKYLQVSPGCRKYISPFLLEEQKVDIHRKKQENQFKYRQILVNQIKQKQKQKYQQKKRQSQQDMKYQKQFYDRINKYKNRDLNQKSYRFRHGGQIQNRRQHDIRTYQKSLFKKSKQLTLPTLLSPYYSVKNEEPANVSIITRNNFRNQDNDLKKNSLIEIGRKLRQNYLGKSLIDQDRIQYQNSYQNQQKFLLKSFDKPNLFYKDLRHQLRQKQAQVYKQLQKSTNFLKSTKSPIRQLKKRLRTQPIYIPEDDPQDYPQESIPMRYRIRTQFGSYMRHNDQQIFYRLPSGLRSSLDSLGSSTINSDSSTINTHDSTAFTLRLQSDTLSRHEHGKNMRIQENPEEQENQSQAQPSARFYTK